jgi:hypothetical protein
MRRAILLAAGLLAGSCAHPVPVVAPAAGPEDYNLADEAKDTDRVCVRTEAGASWRLCMTVGNLKHLLTESRKLPNQSKVAP